MLQSPIISVLGTVLRLFIRSLLVSVGCRFLSKFGGGKEASNGLPAAVPLLEVVFASSAPSLEAALSLMIPLIGATFASPALLVEAVLSLMTSLIEATFILMTSFAGTVEGGRLVLGDSVDRGRCSFAGLV